MKNQNEYYNAISNVAPTDEDAVKNALVEAGLFSKSGVFPLASLQFELTSHCNAYCKHCYNNSGIQNKIPDAMTPDKWISFAKYLVKHGGVFECLLSGGEPLLLGDKLFELMDILHDDGTLFLLQTNGFLLNEKVAKRLKKYRYHWLQVSIDGTDSEYHDSFRQLRGSWEKAITGVSFATANGIPTKIAHCVTPYNLDDIDDMCALAYSLGASAITVGELCFSGRASQNVDLLLSEEQQAYLFQKVKENYFRYEGRMMVKTSNKVKAGLERQRKKPSSAALIRPNGDIRIDGMAPFVIGNILKDDFAEVWSQKINSSWANPKVVDFLSSFNPNDRNYSIINFIDDDIYI